ARDRDDRPSHRPAHRGSFPSVASIEGFPLSDSRTYRQRLGTTARIGPSCSGETRERDLEVPGSTVGNDANAAEEPIRGGMPPDEASAAVRTPQPCPVPL